jgi:hypothetical protein
MAERTGFRELFVPHNRRLDVRVGAAFAVILAVMLGVAIAAPSGAAAAASTVVAAQAAAAPAAPRAGNCPAATVSVASAKKLQAALDAARAGTVIKLAAGTYVGEFKVSRSGSAGSPIWLCGPRSAVLTSGTMSSGHALSMSGVKNFVAAGFSINKAFKGVTVISGSRVTITDLAISNIGYEAIHFRNQTVDSSATNNVISRTGMVTAKYGEGIYIGTSGANWCKSNGCNPDRTDRILARGNKISSTGAQPIEAKEGTTGGRIDSNTVTGSSRIEAGAKSLILVKGNGYNVTGNVVTAPRAYGLQTIADNGWGRKNSFSANTIKQAPITGIWIHMPSGQGAAGNVVYCSNKAPGATLTNLACAR